MVSLGDADSKKSRRRRRPTHEQKFSSYLSFGGGAAICLGCFLVLYMIVLLCASPLLLQDAPQESHLQRGQVLQPVVDNVRNLPHNVPVIAEHLKDQLQNFRKMKGETDLHLMDKAKEAMELFKKSRMAVSDATAKRNAAIPAEKEAGDRKGFVVLGMHRSGTSMLSGILVTGMGYNVGGPLIGSAADNEKGFFELLDAVLQNDEFMNLQRVWWSANMMQYNNEKALEAKKSGKATFAHGEKALKFLNNPDNSPWLQKDPRMCITLKTWLPLLNSEPAVLWTYRHPMEVAHSLMHREKGISLCHGLRLWIVYNMLGLQNSADLCRVYSSNDAILADPLHEVKRLSAELTSKCGVPSPPEELTQDKVEVFVDTSLQHNKKKLNQSQTVIAQYGDCKVYDIVTNTAEGTPEYDLERTLYLLAMKLYCDMESGKAYSPDFSEWPVLP